MGSVVISEVVSDISHHPHTTMLGGGAHQTSTSDPAYRSSRTSQPQSSSATSRTAAAVATPTSATESAATSLPFSDTPQSSFQHAQPTIATPVAIPPRPTQNPPPSASMRNPPRSQPQPEYPMQSAQGLNQHARGFDQSGFPLTSDPRGLTSSSPSSPRLQPTYRSTRSLGGSEATSPSRIKVRNLSHIQSFASEELLTQPRIPRPGRGFQDVGRQYEISSMPVADIIEMVAGLLTKITTTNDQQHEHLHRHIPPPEGTTGLSQQTTSVLAFHGKNVPSITILSYLSRIHKYCPTTYEVFLSLLVYFDRMTELVNNGFLQSMRQQAGGSSMFRAPEEPPASPLPMIVEPMGFEQSERAVATPPSSASMAPRDPPLASPKIPPSPLLPEDSSNLSHFFVVDSFNIHRLVIAGVTCASKFFSDVFYTNSRYAKVCLGFSFPLHFSNTIAYTFQVGGLPLVELNHLELQFLLLNDFRLSVPVEELEAYGTMLVEFYAREVVTQQQHAQHEHQQRQTASHPGIEGVYMMGSSSGGGVHQTPTPP